MVAFILAYRSLPVKNTTSLMDIASRKIIKGLRPFEFDDADNFAKLQRETSLKECLEAISDHDFRFGILCGESGCGKTSFLQAGLWPALEITNHQCIYLRFTDSDPLELIRQAFGEKFSLPRNELEGYDFVSLLKSATSAGSKPLVLLFDQFEQFFVHQKQKEEREPFIQSLAQWFRQNPSLPVKILICLRGDFYDRLIELQKAMGYSLSPQQNFRLENFTPKEAAEIFRVIAEIEDLPIDEKFVEDLTEKELASHEDGLVSGVDLQILAWMIQGQRSAEEQAFTRTAYLKLGGIEGLLERFLLRTLQARETESRRKAALKILLALTDLESNLREGVLTADDLQTKLMGTVSSEEIQEALEWLCRGDVRLVTPVKRNLIQGYELAHERIIPALRRLIGKSLSAVDQTNQLLERRVHEWLGNDRSRRYLLRASELHLIKKQEPYLAWGTLKDEKTALLSLSQRRFWIYVAGLTFPFLSILILSAWLLRPLDFPRGVVWIAKVVSIEQLRGNIAINYDGQIGTIKPDMLRRLGSAFKKAGDFENLLQQTKEIGDPKEKVAKMSAMARVLALTNDTDRASEFLTEARHAAEQIPSNDGRNFNLFGIAVTTAIIAKELKDVKFLQQAFDNAQGIDDDSREKQWFYSTYVVASAVIAGKENNAGLLKESVKLADEMVNNGGKLQALSAIAAAHMEISTDSDNQEFMKPVFQLAKTFSNDRDLAILVMTQEVRDMAIINNDTNLILKALDLADRLELTENKNKAFSLLSEGIIEITRMNTDKGLIERTQALVEKINDASLKDLALSTHASVYALLSLKSEDMKLLQKAHEICGTVNDVSIKDRCLAYSAFATAQIAGATQNLALLNQAIQEEKIIKNSQAKQFALNGISEAYLRFGYWYKVSEIIDKTQDQSILARGFPAMCADVLEAWAERDDPVLEKNHN